MSPHHQSPITPFGPPAQGGPLGAQKTAQALTTGMRIMTPLGDILEIEDHREGWIVAGVMFQWRIWRLADYDDRCRAAHHAADRYRRATPRERWWRRLLRIIWRRRRR